MKTYLYLLTAVCAWLIPNYVIATDQPNRHPEHHIISIQITRAYSPQRKMSKSQAVRALTALIAKPALILQKGNPAYKDNFTYDITESGCTSYTNTKIDFVDHSAGLVHFHREPRANLLRSIQFADVIGITENQSDHNWCDGLVVRCSKGTTGEVFAIAKQDRNEAISALLTLWASPRGQVENLESDRAHGMGDRLTPNG